MAAKREARRFAEEIFAVMFAWLLLFTAVGEIAMPLSMYVIAPGFAGDQDKFDLSVALTRIAFPYLLFMSLTALQSGDRSTACAVSWPRACAPILLNLVMIATLLFVHSSAGATARRRAMRWSGAYVAAGVAAVPSALHRLQPRQHAHAAQAAEADARRRND